MSKTSQKGIDNLLFYHILMLGAYRQPALALFIQAVLAGIRKNRNCEKHEKFSCFSRLRKRFFAVSREVVFHVFFGAASLRAE
jgi:hypothetical protein